MFRLVLAYSGARRLKWVGFLCIGLSRNSPNHGLGWLFGFHLPETACESVTLLRKRLEDNSPLRTLTKFRNKFTNRPTWRGKKLCGKFFVYVPTDVARSGTFPSKVNERVKVRINAENRKVTIEKLCSLLLFSPHKHSKK